jgi:hypothetical protein
MKNVACVVTSFVGRGRGVLKKEDNEIWPRAWDTRGGSRIFCREGSNSGADPEAWFGGRAICWPKISTHARRCGGSGVLPRNFLKFRTML